MAERRYYYYRSDDYIRSLAPTIQNHYIAESVAKHKGHYCGSCLWYDRGWCHMYNRDESYVGFDCDSYRNGYEGAIDEVKDPIKEFTSYVIDPNYVYGIK